jgi:hypothetical protein
VLPLWGPCPPEPSAQGETYADLAGGFGIGTTTVHRYLHEALDLLAALAPALARAIEVARGKAHVIFDGTLRRIGAYDHVAGVLWRAAAAPTSAAGRMRSTRCARWSTPRSVVSTSCQWHLPTRPRGSAPVCQP